MSTDDVKANAAQQEVTSAPPSGDEAKAALFTIEELAGVATVRRLVRPDMQQLPDDEAGLQALDAAIAQCEHKYHADSDAEAVLFAYMLDTSTMWRYWVAFANLATPEEQVQAAVKMFHHSVAWKVEIKMDSLWTEYRGGPNVSHARLEPECCLLYRI